MPYNKVMKILLTLLLVSVLCLPADATTICVDKGGTMAGDSQVTVNSGDEKGKLFGFQKLSRINNCLVGCCGNIQDIKKFREWFASRSAHKPVLESMTALVVKWDNSVWEYDESCIPHQVQLPHAIGTGWKAAMAAMKAGTDAKRAVEIAGEIDLNTGGPVSELRLERR